MTNLEQNLAEKKTGVAVTQGNSMYPMLQSGDTVLIKKADFPLKKGDVPVYHRDDHLTMHRIIHVGRKGYVICGDNRQHFERDITEEKIIGVLAAYRHEEKWIDCETDKAYLRYKAGVCRFYLLRLIQNFFWRGFQKLKRMARKA